MLLMLSLALSTGIPAFCTVRWKTSIEMLAASASYARFLNSFATPTNMPATATANAAARAPPSLEPIDANSGPSLLPIWPAAASRSDCILPIYCWAISLLPVRLLIASVNAPVKAWPAFVPATADVRTIPLLNPLNIAAACDWLSVAAPLNVLLNVRPAVCPACCAVVFTDREALRTALLSVDCMPPEPLRALEKPLLMSLDI